MNDQQPQGGSVPFEALVVRAIVIAIAVTLTLVAATVDPFHLLGA
ncbi:hypothetical protein ACFC18_10285 [Streptomyces sp. NPDC056121]